MPGAGGAGIDCAPVADAIGQTNFDPGWMDFNVTAGVQRSSGSTPTASFSWKLEGVGGCLYGNKRFCTSGYVDDPALQPKVEIRHR